MKARPQPFAAFPVRFFLWTVLLGAIGAPAALRAGDRIAFVVGVDRYDRLPPQNQLQVAVRDATRMAETLRGLSPAFEVTLLTDTDWKTAQERFDTFLDRAKGAECALVYFAGHGVEYHGENFLLVRDSDISDISDDVPRMKRRLATASISAQSWVDSLDATGAQVKLVVLDCCRDNPLQASDPSGRRAVVGSRQGLAQMTPPSGSLISYAADAGQQANDGLFTEVLTRHLKNPGLSILKVFAATREEVLATSSGWATEDEKAGLPAERRRVRHEPAEYNKLNLAGTDFVFNGGGAAMVPPPRPIAEPTDPFAGKTAGQSQRNALGMALRWCPAGEFWMGSPEGEAGRDDDEARHRVALSRGFWLGQHEVTQGEWETVTGRTLRDQAGLMLRDDTLYTLGGKKQTLRDYLGTTRDADPQTQIGNEDADLPIYDVNWEEAVEFCRKLTERERGAGRLPAGWEYRLPTEAEWEYACRAGSSTALYTGKLTIAGENNSPELEAIAWYGGNSSVGYEGRGWSTDSWEEKQFPGGRAGPRKVGTKAANEWGLHDMIGNVYEWCGDWVGDYPANFVTDPKGADGGSYRVFRGGSWYSIARDCRSADRFRDTPSIRLNSLGFRVALSSTR